MSSSLFVAWDSINSFYDPSIDFNISFTSYMINQNQVNKNIISSQSLPEDNYFPETIMLLKVNDKIEDTNKAKSKNKKKKSTKKHSNIIDFPSF